MRLFHYDHCPYCVKARMALGLFSVQHQDIVLLNDDEAVPIKMIGKKMVPILEYQEGKFMAESLDIIDYLKDLTGNKIAELSNEKYLAIYSDLADYVYKLAMPRWVNAPLAEFATDSAKSYFTKKKEIYIGSFNENLANTGSYKEAVEVALGKLSIYLADKRFIHGAELSYDDFHLFALLRSLSIVKDLIWPQNILEYLEKISRDSSIDLHFAISI